MSKYPEALVERVAKEIAARDSISSWETDGDAHDEWRDMARAALDAAGVAEMMEALRRLEYAVSGESEPVRRRLIDERTAARDALAKWEGR